MSERPAEASAFVVPACIVVGVDASESARRALRWAAAMASALGARLVAVHAVGLLEGAGYQSGFDPQAAVDEVARGDAVAVSEPGPPDQVLLRVAAREAAHLVVVGHRGVGGSLRFIGSTSEAVLAATTVPVVVVP